MHWKATHKISKGNNSVNYESLRSIHVKIQVDISNTFWVMLRTKMWDAPKDGHTDGRRLLIYPATVLMEWNSDHACLQLGRSTPYHVVFVCCWFSEYMWIRLYLVFICLYFVTKWKEFMWMFNGKFEKSNANQMDSTC